MIRVDRETFWNILKIYGVGRQLLGGIKIFYKEASAYMSLDGVLNESFLIGVGMRQRCVTSLWLLDIFFINWCIREMTAKVKNIRARLRMNGMGWVVVVCLFADNTVIWV